MEKITINENNDLKFYTSLVDEDNCGSHNAHYLTCRKRDSCNMPKVECLYCECYKCEHANSNIQLFTE